MRVYSSIQPLEMHASDFDNDDYIGKRIKKHPQHGVIALLESRSSQPKRFMVIVSNRTMNYYLSHQEALSYYNSIK